MEEARASEVLPAICAFCRRHKSDADRAACGDCQGGEIKPKFEPRRPWMTAFHWVGIFCIILFLGFSTNVVLKIANNGYYTFEAVTAGISLLIAICLAVMAKREDSRQ